MSARVWMECDGLDWRTDYKKLRVFMQIWWDGSGLWTLLERAEQICLQMKETGVTLSNCSGRVEHTDCWVGNLATGLQRMCGLHHGCIPMHRQNTVANLTEVKGLSAHRCLLTEVILWVLRVLSKAQIWSNPVVTVLVECKAVEEELFLRIFEAANLAAPLWKIT